jgi:ABC-type Mn2+/Zn2+ transport system permease subunit
MGFTLRNAKEYNKFVILKNITKNNRCYLWFECHIIETLFHLIQGYNKNYTMDNATSVLIQWLLEPLQFAFMQRAILAVVIVGLVTGVMGAYVVTRGLAFMGDTLAHSILPGVAIAFISGGEKTALLVGGLIAGTLSAVVIGLLTYGRRLGEDTAIGIVFAGMLALGIGIISAADNVGTDLQHILIGNILAVTSDDLLLMALIGMMVLGFVWLFYKELLVVSFDALLAETLHLPGLRLHILLLVLLAVTTVIGFQVVGVAMIAATLVTPAATARFFTNRLHILMLLAAFIACGCGIVGMYIAWYAHIAASAAIVLLMTFLFALAFLFAPHKGYIWSLRARRIKNKLASA